MSFENPTNSKQLISFAMAGLCKKSTGSYDGIYAETNLDDSPNKQKGIGKVDDIHIVVMDGNKKVKIKIF